MSGLTNAQSAHRLDCPGLVATGILAQAFHASLPALMAMGDDQLEVVNFDIVGAAATALGVEKRINTWRAKIVTQLPSFDVTWFDCLGQYARAMLYTHVQYSTARKRAADVHSLVAASRKQYRMLLADTRALVERGLISNDVLNKLKGKRGYLEAAFKLLALTNFLREALPSLSGKSALSLDELDRAETQAEATIDALAHRRQPLQDLAKLAKLRQRAFTVFHRAYQEVRRAIQYLCRGDATAEKLVPTLYPRRRRAAQAKAAENQGMPTIDAVTVAENALPFEVAATQETATIAPVDARPRKIAPTTPTASNVDSIGMHNTSLTTGLPTVPNVKPATVPGSPPKRSSRTNCKLRKARRKKTKDALDERIALQDNALWQRPEKRGEPP